MLKIGDMVDYHSVIGEEITSRNHIIKAVQMWSSGKMVAWITDKSGCVAIDALSLTPTEDRRERNGI